MFGWLLSMWTSKSIQAHRNKSRGLKRNKYIYMAESSEINDKDRKNNTKTTTAAGAAAATVSECLWSIQMAKGFYLKHTQKKQTSTEVLNATIP